MKKVNYFQETINRTMFSVYGADYHVLVVTDAKNLLTFPPQNSIVIKVARAADRKVGIHLTLARASDPGS